MKFHVAVMMTLLAVVSADATYRQGYYDRMDGKKRESLKAAAKECVSAHQRLVYYELPVYWQFSDVYPEDYNGCKRWWEMYSANIYLIANGQSALKSFSSNRMQREHAVPKSWWKSGGDVEYTPAYSDMWNLYPSDGSANQAKLNYPLGVVRNASFDNGVSKVGSAAPGQGGGSAYVFEPADEYKGDFARAFFYMATVYDDLPWTYTYMFTQEAYPTLVTWARQTLLQWARMDPVSQKEIDRNDAVEVSQGNRNPFIDFPELAEYIWGTRTSETFFIADQESGIVTPPITGDPEISRPVNGEALDFGQVAVGVSKNVPLEILGKNLTAPLSVRIVGDDKECYQAALSQIPASNINLGNTYLLNIAYTPLDIRSHTARVLLYDGGLPDGKNIAVTLRGEGCPVPDLSQLTAYAARDISETGYTASWSVAPQVVDYYVLSRTRLSDDGDDDESTEEIEVNGTSYTVNDATPDSRESYKVCSSRLGYRSEWSENVYVSTVGADVAEIDAPAPSIGMLPGGFMLIAENPVARILVYDAAGRSIMELSGLNPYETVYLPKGMYVVDMESEGIIAKIVITR